MFRTSLFRGVCTALFACAFALPLSVRADQSVPLAGHLPPALASAQRLQRIDAGEQVNLALVLPLHNQDQLADLLHRLYTPGDMLYGQYLTPDAFARQFSPTQAEYNAVIAFAQSQGLTVTATHANRTVLEVAGNAKAVENAFGVQLNKYQGADGRVFRAPSAEPQIPATLAGHLAAVVGLDTAAVWKTHSREKTPAVPAAGGKLLADPRQIGSGPGGGLTPSDIKTAYNMNAISSTGTGQALALFELTGYTASDITAYETFYGLPNVPLQNVLVSGATGAPGSGADEVTLDIELQLAVAPSISKIYVYEGPNSNAGVVATYNKIATDNLAKSVSTSWGLPEFSSTSATRNSENQAFQQMAAQGQSIFAASGDSGAYDNKTSISVDDPASQPYMTGVGGTSLATTGAGGAWKSETTWNGGSIGAGAGGGGISGIWPKPTYQSTFGWSSSFRNVPDVSLDADPNTGYSIYYAGGWRIYGGTSCAAPIWSGFVACVNQNRVASGKGTLGFANTLLYQLGASSNYAADFHDVNDSSTNLYWSTNAGYDNATGWGTLNGANLFADLVNGSAVSSSQTVYRIHTGGGTIGAFNPDNYFTGGTLWTATQNIDTTGVTNAAPMAVYQTQRYGNIAYNMPNLTPGASYTVRLHFAESYFTTLGQRVINVSINGTKVLSNFDAATAAGAVNKAVVEEFTTAADSTGNINITLTAVSNWPLINGVEVISGVGTSVPSAPTGLIATAGNAQVSLTWNTVPGAASYKVYRSTTSGSGYAVIGTPTANAGLDTTVTNGTTYYYVVSAVNTNGESAASAQVSATPTAQQAAIYRIHSGNGTIGTFNPDNYYTGGSVATASQNIDTSGVTNAAPMAVYQTQRYGNFSYIMPALTPGTSYTVRLHFAESYFTTLGLRFFNVAINGATVLANFDPATAAGAANKAVVREFTAVADSTGKITITFTAVSNWPLVNGVEILSGTGTSVPSAPTGLTATAGSAQVALAWNTAAGATSYKVYRSTTSGSGYAVIGTPATTTFTDTSVTNGTTYYYVVSAINGNGESAVSSEVSSTPSAQIAAYKFHSGTGVIGSYNPDNFYTGGTLYSVSQNINTAGVANAAPMAVYQTQRYGNFSYNMPNLTPGKSYTVRLHFAESYFTVAGLRFFNVAINNTTVLANFDIATVAGAVNKALVEDFTAVADSTGKISITFTAVSNLPLVNGVEILP